MSDGNKERWQPGETAWFEYHCNESHDSAHAEWWYRSHQQVTVVSGPTFDDQPVDTDPAWDFAARAESGNPNCYIVRFADGFSEAAAPDCAGLGDSASTEGVTVFEDELVTDPKFFVRPNPPAPRKTGAHA